MKTQHLPPDMIPYKETNPLFRYDGLVAGTGINLIHNSDGSITISSESSASINLVAGDNISIQKNEDATVISAITMRAVTSYKEPDISVGDYWFHVELN